MKKLPFLTALLTLIPLGAHAASFPDWSSNGPALIGAKNGIAGLDSEGAVIAPVIGNTSNASVTAASTPTPRSMADRASDILNIKDFHVSVYSREIVLNTISLEGNSSRFVKELLMYRFRNNRKKILLGLVLSVIITPPPTWAASSAGLDSAGAITAPVSGDTSNASVLATSTTTARTLADRASDTLNVKDFGAQLNGSDSDKDILNKAFSSNGNKKIIMIPSGTWPSQTWYPTATSGNFVEVPGFLNNPPNTSITDYGINVGVYNFGSGVTSVTHGGQYFPNSIMTSRVSTGKTDTSYNPLVSHRQVIDGPNDNHDGNNTEENITVTTANSSGYATNVFDKMFSLGHGYYGSFDVNHWSRIDVYGTNWAWDGIQEFGESVTYFCNSGTQDATYCPAHYINEIDFGGYGQDDPAAKYNPDKSTRTMYLLSTNTMAARNTSRASWKASTVFWRYQQVVVKDSSGKPWIFYALPIGYKLGGTSNAASGKSGSTAPTWVFTKGSTVVDSGVTWYCVGPFTYDIGALIKISGGNNPDTGYVERIGTVMEETNDYIYNSIFDMSIAKFDPSVPYNVFARLQKDMWLDLTADGTQAGQNNHLFGYKSSSSALTYKVKGSDVFSISDTGVTSLGGVKPIVSTNTLSSIKSGTYTEGTRLWCHDCRAAGQGSSAGTGRWIYLDSARTWRTDDSVEAVN